MSLILQLPSHLALSVLSPLSSYKWMGLGWFGLGSLCGAVIWAPLCGAKGSPQVKKNGKKRGHCPHVGEGGQPQFPFLAQIYRNLSGPQITQKLTQTPWKYNFLSHFFVIFRPFRSLLIQWVQGVWFLIILRAFYIKMSRVASRIYALLSVIRQQMSPFDPFRGGGDCPKGQCPLFLPFFFI